MKRVFLSFYIISAFTTLCSQNLVKNPSFEISTNCPGFVGQISLATYWKTPSTGSPDYFHTCAGATNIGVPNNAWGKQYPRTGEAYAGLNLIYYTITDFREYIQGELTSTLQANSTYKFEMYINVAENSRHATDALGVYFSSTVITGATTYSPLPYTPQITNTPGIFFTDTINWIKFSANYKASGGEKYLVIGNFKNDATTTSSLINTGGNQTNGYIYIDDVSLVDLNPAGISAVREKNEFKISPNPFRDYLSISCGSEKEIELKIYDITSQKVYEDIFDNSVLVNTNDLAKGFYIYELRSNDGSVKKGKLLKD